MCLLLLLEYIEEAASYAATGSLPAMIEITSETEYMPEKWVFVISNSDGLTLRASDMIGRPGGDFE